MKIKTLKKKLIEEIGRCPLPTDFGDWTYLIFFDFENHCHHEMLIFGNITEGSLSNGKNILVRIHSACRTNETYHALNCECGKELHKAMKLIQKSKKGVILYLDQEGRGNGIEGKIAQLNGMFEWNKNKIFQKINPLTNERIDTDTAYKNAGYPSEARNFDIAGEILKTVGIKSIRLLTNNPIKRQGVENSGIKVTPIEILIDPENEIIASDLKSKAINLGHKIPKRYWKCKKQPINYNMSCKSHE